MNCFLRSSFGLLALAVASTAQAQDVVDPIGSILDQVDEETAENIGTGAPAAPAPPAPAPVAPYGSPPRSSGYAPPPATIMLPPVGYAARPHPTLTAPVNVDEDDKTPEAPLNSLELGYESRLRSSFASAQGMQGPMDGAWTLRGSDGQQLYALQLVDKGGGGLEGAWRDPRRRGSTDASGFLADAQRVGGQITARFYPSPGAGGATLTLTPGGVGVWTGELSEGGARVPVTLRRD